MTLVKPFKAVRPVRNKVHLVASRSYVSYDEIGLRSKLASNPYSFIHIINPEFSKNTAPVQGKQKFKLVKERFEEFVNDGVYIQEDKPAYYIYRQTKNGNSYTGYVLGTSVDDYRNGVIKIHEDTLTEREEMFCNYLDITGFNAEPVLMCYPDNSVLHCVMDKYTEQRAEYEFTTTNEVLHELWIVTDDDDMETIKDGFEQIPAVYIADGHHRSASSALLTELRREQNPNYTGEEPFNYFLSYMIPETQMNIMDFNRLVRDINGLTKKELIEKIEENFTVNSMGEQLYAPRKKHEISMYIEGEWFSLVVNPGTFDATNPVEDLDAHILTEKILAPILNIQDLKTDKRINFLGGQEGMVGLQNEVDTGKFKIAFALYPVEVEQLKRIADTGNKMPPKSTYIEPKLRSGLLIYKIDE